MGSLGLLEILLMLPVMLLSAAVPVATLVYVFLTYKSVKQIEETLSARGTDPGMGT